MAVYAHINSVPNGSTGGIVMKRHHELLKAGHESHVFWGRGRRGGNEREHRFATDAEVNFDVLQTRLDGRAGFHSKAATRRLLSKLDEVCPDVVCLHNLHGYYLNIEMLFEWLAGHDCHVEWTLHDCWAFTGHCAYFTYAECGQWRTHCAKLGGCPQLYTYPKTVCGRSCARNFTDKRRIFTSVPPERMALVAPSHWLEGLVRESFLGGYPVEVRHNTVDKSVFTPTPSDFRERYGIGDRFMILGVASPWSDRKGLGDFIRLAGELGGEKIVIVLVGLSERQVKSLPEGIIGLTRTDSPQELAGIYATADVFFNPTVEDNYPTVNLEAEACGTPVITYDTGGCGETVSRADSSVVEGYEEAMARLSDIRSLIR